MKTTWPKQKEVSKVKSLLKYKFDSCTADNVDLNKELDSNIFALPIHDCIISTENNVPLIKEMLISKTKNIYSTVISDSTDLDKLFKTSLVSIDNSSISNKNWVKYIMDEGEDRDNYIEEYGIDYPYEPLGPNED